MLQKINILGINITNEKKKKISEYVVERISQEKKSFLVTPNPEILVYASKHPEFKKLLNTADIALPDGVGITVAAKILNRPIQERVTGVDFIETLCKSSREKPLSMGFLGGKGGVAERAVLCLKKKYPWIMPVWVGEEWNTERGWITEIKDDVIRYSYKKEYKRIDILFVAFGFPKQEEWIAKNLPEIPATAALGVGGAFDYLSGEVIRAPVFLRKLGLEWLFRLFRQPWRIKRQAALITFIGLVVKEKLKKK